MQTEEEENQKTHESKSEITLSFRSLCGKGEFSSQKGLLRKIAS